MINLSEVASWASILGSLVSIVGIVTGLIQIFHFRSAKFAELRPYLEVTYGADTTGVKTRVLLEIKNVGRTPARNVTIQFNPGVVWHHIAKPDFPFTAKNGIHQIPVGETFRYFVGELGSSSEFDRIQKQSIRAYVQYEAIFKSTKIRDEADISLMYLRYSKSLKPRGK